MTRTRRRLALGAVLVLAAGFTCAYVLGDPARDKAGQIRFGGPRSAGGMAEDILTDLGTTRFADQPVVTYRSKDGDLLFGWQLRPKLDAAAERPRDFVLVVDTSASQAGGSLLAGLKVAETLLTNLNPDDRVAVRTANVRDVEVTRGFVAPDKAKAALKPLFDELPMGAVDLKATLTAAVQSFESRGGRQQLLVYLGDGVSVLNPFRPADLAEVAATMVKNEIAFFPVPLGLRLDPATLHGLASATGGAPVRVLPGDSAASSVTRALEVFAAPILYPNEATFPIEVVQRYPSDRLPPLRGDLPTLVVGKLMIAAPLSVTVKGTVAGRPTTVVVKNDTPEAEIGNFFLAGLVRQWESAKEMPALVRADRALAFAEQSNHMAKTEFLTQGELAVGQGRYDAAVRLFEQALALDPESAETESKVDMARNLRDGKITKAQLEREAKERARKPRRNVLGKGDAVALLQKSEVAPPPRPVEAPLAPPQAEQDILQEAKKRQAIEDQRAAQVADEAIRQANSLLQTNPDDAAEVLKRALENARNNFGLSDRARLGLASRLERAHRDVVVQGATVKQNIEFQRQQAIRAQERADLLAAQQSRESRIRERMRVFNNLMAQTREKEAYLQAQNIRQDLVSQGAAVPVAVTAAYQIAQSAYHLREIQELRRVREEKYLLAQLQVERSAIPFPDEPPVVFPPAATWKRLSDDRLKRYQATPLAAGDPERSRRVWSQLTKPITFDNSWDAQTTLKEALEELSIRNDIRFELYPDDFVDPSTGQPIAGIESTPIADGPGGMPKLKNVSLTRVLRMMLSAVNKKHPNVKATYIIRDDAVEIVPGALAATELVTVSHDVGDLVIPIPNSFNQQAVQQSGSLFGAFGAQGGFGGFAGLGGGGQLGFQGGLGGLGGGGLAGLGGGLAGLGGGLGGLGGGLAGLGGGLGGLGGGLAGLGGGLGGGIGGLGGIAGGGLAGLGGGAGGFGGGGQNLGAGGGLAGLGGGQLGQFGNLGGQFGLQGGDHYPVLIATIRIAVGDGPKDWGRLDPYTASLIPKDPNVDETAEQEGRSTLGPYRPALALFVKGPSQIFHRKVRPIPTAGQAPVAFNDNPDRNRPLVDNGAPKGRNAVAGAGADDKAALAKNDPKGKIDPKAYWQDALARGSDSPLVVAECVDVLAKQGKWDHVAELLKANLRQGVVVRPWCYEALAMALRETKASPEEIERAEVSAADLEPLDAKGFLRAAKAMDDLKRPDRALAFCRQAAALDPSGAAAFKNALVYAESAKDRDGMAWAAGKLLANDWPRDNDVVHDSASFKLEGLARTLKDENRPRDAGRLLDVLKENRVRDLEISLLWQDGTTADLDLKVEEPTGAVCSWLNRQTIGGGTLLGGLVPGKKEMEQKTAAETYVAARAFSGDYKVTVERNWGSTATGKAQLRVVRHKGTAQQSEELVTVDLTKKVELTVTLENGRRNEAATVSVDAAEDRPEEDEASSNGGQRVVEGLAGLVYGTSTAATRPTVRGGMGVFGAPQSSTLSASRNPATDSPLQQTRLTAGGASTPDVTAKASVTGDGRHVRVSVSPLYNMAAAIKGAPTVRHTVIPGGGSKEP